MHYCIMRVCISVNGTQAKISLRLFNTFLWGAGGEEKLIEWSKALNFLRLVVVGTEIGSNPQHSNALHQLIHSLPLSLLEG